MAAPSTVSKKELRRKLETMKKAYAKTLCRVQRSEKAKRSRSHVQRKIAEQTQHVANDTSPLCTRSMKPTHHDDTNDKHISSLHLTGLMASITNEEALEDDIKGDKEEAHQPQVASRRAQRKRCVSFAIPKEKSTSRNSMDDIPGKITDSCPRDSQDNDLHGTQFAVSAGVQEESTKTPGVDILMNKKICDSYDQETSNIKKASCTVSVDEQLPAAGKTICTKTVSPSDQLCVEMARNRDSKSFGNSRCDRNDKAILVDPESQMTDALHVSLNESNHHESNPQSADKIGSGSSIGCTDKQSLQPDPECISSPVPVSGSHLDSSNTIPSADSVSEPPPNLNQSSKRTLTRRASRKRRSRNPHQMTVADISLKDVVESQSTEEGSHTWIEGLMFPAEYYVRQTRSMTSSQCSQSDLDNFDSQNMETESVGKRCITGVGEGVIETDSDTTKSQLSESLFKNIPDQTLVHEFSDFKEGLKSTRSAKNRKLQRRRGIGKTIQQESGSKTESSTSFDSAHLSEEETSNTDAMTKSDSGTLSVSYNKHEETLTSKILSHGPVSKPFDTTTNIPCGSSSDFLTGKLKHDSRKVPLSQADFSLPDEDFGAMKLLKLQCNSAGDISGSGSKLENCSAGVKSSSDAIKQSCRSKRCEDHLLLGPATTCIEDEGVSQVKSILHSQLSPSQCRGGLCETLAYPVCTPGLSPSTDDINDKLSLSKQAPLPSLVMTLGVENRSSVCNKQPSVPQSPRVRSSENKSQQEFTQPMVPDQPVSGGQTCNGLFHLEAEDTIPDDPSRNVTSIDGNVTPPNTFSEVKQGGSVDARGNINQTSPFAAVATGTPPGRAEEPKTMSQCEMKSNSMTDDEVVMGDTDRSSSKELNLLGCLQHDVPWEPLATVVGVAVDGRVYMNGEAVSIIAVWYHHTLILWCNHTDTTQYQILQSWLLSKDEEFQCVRFMPCNHSNTVLLVMTGKFSTCAIRMMNYDIVTKETQQMDVNLSPLSMIPVPYIVCATSEHEFAVAVKDDRHHNAVFLVHTCIESSDVQTVKLSVGDDSTYLTSLLQVDNAQRILVAITSHNHLLLWNCEMGKLTKDVMMKPVNSRSVMSCVKATAEMGLLFLVMVFGGDPDNEAPIFPNAIGATMVLNPHTNKMATLVEYHLLPDHADASSVIGVIHNNSLLVQLSDGSIHQWDILSGDLMNYSSSTPANQSLRCASIDNVLILGNNQCQQVFVAY